LYPNGRKLSDEKLKDVKSLLQFVLPIFHTFYTNLEANTNEDVIEQSDSDADEVGEKSEDSG
jgi:hypothetical protein